MLHLTFCEFRVPRSSISSEQLRAARALLRWEQTDLCRESGVSLATIRRLEGKPGALAAHASTVGKLVGAVERAGVRFVEADGEGEGVRFTKARRV